MRAFLKRIDIKDIFEFLGLVLGGTGLFLWVGLGISLTVIGGLLFCMGFFSGVVRMKN